MDKNQIINNFINEEIIDSENINFLSNLNNWNNLFKEKWSYNLFETFKIIFNILINYNKDFTLFKEEVNDEILKDKLIEIINWKSIFIIKSKWKISFSNKNNNNTLIWWNSINLCKIIKKILTKNYINIFKKPEHLFYEKYSELVDTKEEEKRKMNQNAWKVLYELLSVCLEIEKNWSNS